MAFSDRPFWDSLCVYFLRPVIASVFVFSFIFLGWLMAWKLVLVHVPIVQEICGLRKKPKRPKPETDIYYRHYDKFTEKFGFWGEDLKKSE
ncbi:uncharacterized protein [Aristolochia californica]|uniref:uncharacterized protein n=1 Tax=Aristolochia californica TaxID=171875 RepID=UPI0035E12A11